ncbi:MAG: S8 family serine peptidase [Planctomycetota bacterium]|nr:S8 family serine peptidase [Planctomycetota bacterium]
MKISASTLALTTLLTLAAGAASASADPVWVFLKPRSVESNPALLAQALDQQIAQAHPKMLERRAWRRTLPGLVDVRDLPLDAAVVDAITAISPARTQSRWLNALSVDATAVQIRQIAALPSVHAVRPVARARHCNSQLECEVATPDAPTDGGYEARDFYGRSSSQLAQMNLPQLHARGFTGQGVIIGILDTGFNRIHAVFNNPAHPLSLIAERDFINDDDNTGPQAGDDGGQHTHGTLILSCIGSYLPDQMVGGAYDASFVLCKTEDVTSETPVEEDYYVEAIEWIESLGGDVTTSSLSYSDWYGPSSYDGVTATTSVVLNLAAANGVHTCTAAGNSGHDADPATARLGAPADALKVLTCGAVDSTGVIAGFSSDGPTFDGRLKPELLAQGVSTACVNPNTADTYATASGTSLSTPLLAAAVACLVEAHPDWTVDEMRTALMQTASDFSTTGQFDPLFIRGYGILNALAAHQSRCAADFNQDGGVDGGDIEAFFTAWEAGDPAADVNRDGGVDGPDIESFFLVWAAGGC